jgi:endonuclease G
MNEDLDDRDIPAVYVEASKRLAEKHLHQREIHRRLAQGGLVVHDTDWAKLRLARLRKNPLAVHSLRAAALPETLDIDASTSPLTDSMARALERIVGNNDFLPAWFLARGAEMRRTVGQVRAIASNGRSSNGTGFLVGPRLLLTNRHVLDWSDVPGQPDLEDIVPQSFLELDYEEAYDGSMPARTTFSLDPDTLLLTSSWNALDYVLVALKDTSRDGRVTIDSYGYNRLVGDLGKIMKGEPVYIIQHPHGQPRQVVIQNNRLIDIDDELPYLTYEADTDGGSSGAPVFNRQWEVVALHHSAEIVRDSDGRVIAKDGTTWRPSLGSDAIKYGQLNEGIRMSRMLEDLATKSRAVHDGAPALEPFERCSAAGAQLLGEMLKSRIEAPPVRIMAPIAAPRAPGRTGDGAGRTTGFPTPD